MPKKSSSDRSLHQAISADGTEISYERHGEGRVLILVAQALSDLRDNRRLAGLLADGHTVVNHDRRGRGGSGDAEAWSVAREIEDIEALVDAHGGRASLLGASSGAVLALDAAAALPDKVEAVIAFEPPVIVDDRRAPVPRDLADRLGKLVDEGRGSDAVREFTRVALGASPLMIGAMRLMIGPWRNMVAMARTTVYDTRLCAGLQDGTSLTGERWSGLLAPSLVLVGSKSEPFVQSGTRELSSLIGARSESIEGAHHATPMMKPAALIPSIVSFLGEVRS
ncbi:alpha/beta hydrolase [uncultured Microbacterium sp.]|uniref:alpha/beta fold hydrolase n=1 Tax=uncultured Microbacterium sp. TaxID=191216 RepID=UPI0028F06B2D|nr:alpha/beta hydrolase [uncultured Microbacterium sp.]